LLIRHLRHSFFVISLQIIDFQTHYNFDAASDVLKNLEAIDVLHQLRLFILQIHVVDLVKLFGGPYFDG
jgi:hypothetical protein